MKTALYSLLLLFCLACEAERDTVAVASEEAPGEEKSVWMVHDLPQLNRRVYLPPTFQDVSIDDWTREILRNDSEAERRDLASYQLLMARALRLPRDARVFLDTTDRRTNISFFVAPQYRPLSAELAEVYAGTLERQFAENYPTESGWQYAKMDGKFMEAPGKRGIKTTYRLDRPAQAAVFITQYLIDNGTDNLVMHVVTPDGERDYLEVTGRIGALRR